MATDLALDYNTGDLVISPTGDLDLRTGTKTIDQRIRVRLRIIQGAWAFDPSNGTLGSRIREMYRMPTWRAASELGLVIREALEPMEDIAVQSVDVAQDADDERKLHLQITYIPIEDGDNADEQTVETTVLTNGVI